MAVIGPSGGRVVLPAVSGRTYPATAQALPRKSFDDVLYRAAIDAGAEAITARVQGVEVDKGEALVQLGGRGCLRAGTVIGADGATSTVAAALDMVRRDRVHWGFAIRTYLRAEVGLPVIILLDEEPGVGFPGYGWLFPGPNGLANAGVGVATGADRRAGVHATRRLDAFLQYLRDLGLLSEHAVAGQRLGGWLNMGMLGTTPAAGPVILVGDAAGLVNPLQGEGIAQALESGAMAASAVANRGNGAASAYNQWLRHCHSSYQGSTAALQGFLLGRPRTVSLLGRLLTWPPLGDRLASGWALYWNDLVSGGPPGNAVAIARMAGGAIRGATVASASRRELDRALKGRPNNK
jgi:flavin-dependent dehydrogenase